jgi:hypothetical protein
MGSGASEDLIAQVAENTSNITGLQGRAQTTDENVTSLTSNVSQLDVKVGGFGDSIGTL